MQIRVWYIFLIKSSSFQTWDHSYFCRKSYNFHSFQAIFFSDAKKDFGPRTPTSYFFLICWSHVWQWRERFSDTLKCQSCSDIPLSREVVITTILPFLSQIYLCVRFYASSHRVIRRTVRHFSDDIDCARSKDFWARSGRPLSVLLDRIGLRPSSLSVSMKRDMRSSCIQRAGPIF